MAEALTTPAAATDTPSDIERLYAYGAWMLGDRSAALTALYRAGTAALPGTRFKDRLPAVRAEVLTMTGVRRQSPAKLAAQLDDKLRLVPSVSLKMGHPALRGDVRRLPLLLTGLMQGCLIAAVQTLPPAVREVFVLLVVLELPERDVLELLDTTPHTLSSYKSKMVAGLEGYLGPRCGHLHPGNPCLCENRLQHALDQQFVELPEHERPAERYPRGVFGDLRRLFAALPPLRLSESTLASFAPARAAAAASAHP